MFCRAFAELMTAEAPERYVAHVKIADRRGRILIDWLRNAIGNTAVASFSPRARPGATVATPLAWDEVTRSSTRRGSRCGRSGSLGSGGSVARPLRYRSEAAGSRARAPRADAGTEVGTRCRARRSFTRRNPASVRSRQSLMRRQVRFGLPHQSRRERGSDERGGSVAASPRRPRPRPTRPRAPCGRENATGSSGAWSTRSRAARDAGPDARNARRYPYRRTRRTGPVARPVGRPAAGRRRPRWAEPAGGFSRPRPTAKKEERNGSTRRPVRGGAFGEQHQIVAAIQPFADAVPLPPGAAA